MFRVLAQNPTPCYNGCEILFKITNTTNLLNKVSDVIETIFNNNGFLCLHGLAFSFRLCSFQKSLLFSIFVFRSIFQQHLEKICCCIIINYNRKDPVSEQYACHFLMRTQIQFRTICIARKYK